MQVTMLKSKIHRATVTQADLHYAGSLTLDPELMEAACLLPFEKISVVNINNGARFETYVIVGERGSGTICLNGAAARLGEEGDLIIILSFGIMSTEEAQVYQPEIVHVDQANQILKVDHCVD